MRLMRRYWPLVLAILLAVLGVLFLEVHVNSWPQWMQDLGLAEVECPTCDVTMDHPVIHVHRR